MHLQPVHATNPCYVNGVSERLFNMGLCIPAGPWVTDEDVAYIVEQIKKSAIRDDFFSKSTLNPRNFNN